MIFRPRRPHTTVAATLCLLVSLGGCSNGGSSSPSASPSTAATKAPSPQGGEEARITIKNFTFTPAELTVSPGTKVTVVNNDSTPHTVTASDKAFDTATIAAGKTATFTAPSRAGAYAYICSIHQYMTGLLKVR
ncbi:cupredoxin family copper-binding protein [Streptomyces sp. 21So2-11]|uniref:cupredoxin domain-containing protein n=1 Tax=Streptomyces sp. 21So2-11 TaxID=3144408 RepID=UPI00321A6C23